MADHDNEIENSPMLDRRLMLLGLAAVPAAASAASERPIDRFPSFNARRMTQDQKINELLDREEIRELIARYAHRTAQGVSVADMFTDDGVFTVRFPGRPPRISTGRAELDKTYANVNIAGDHPLPMIHNQLIVINGHEATGLCSNELRWRENDESMIGSGYYQDSFRRDAGIWKFVSRDMTFIHWVPIQKGWSEDRSMPKR